MAYYKQLSATAQVKDQLGKFIGLVISSTSSGTLKVYDSAPNVGTSGTVMINTLTPAAGSTYYFGPNGMQFNEGLYIVAANTIEFTVIYE